MRAAERIEHGPLRIGAEAERAALMRGVLLLVRVRDHDPEPELPQDALHFGHEALVADDVVRLVVQPDAAVGRQRDAVVLAREVLGDREPVHAARDPGLVRPERNPRHDRLRHHAVRASLRLNLAERVGHVAGAAQIVVVDRHRLLKHGVVFLERMEPLHHRREMRHVAAADQAGGVRETIRVLAG